MEEEEEEFERRRVGELFVGVAAAEDRGVGLCAAYGAE